MTCNNNADFLPKMHFLLIILFVQLIHESSFTRTTPTQNERIRALRQQLNEEIQVLPVHAPLHDVHDYTDTEGPVTPIVEMSVNVDNSVVLAPSVDVELKVENDKITKPNTKKRRRKTTKTRRRPWKKFRKRPRMIFYRRTIDSNILNEEVRWVHCQDILTPYLTGLKRNVSEFRYLTVNDGLVVSFMHLLTVNTTDYNREEILSTMYQISKKNLRLFQWDIFAINKLMTTLTQGRKHTFRNLKWGLKQLFNSWNMDLSNVTSLLTQSKIFRPPCVRISMYDGSTKAPPIKRYTKSTTERTTTPCVDDEE